MNWNLNNIKKHVDSMHTIHTVEPDLNLIPLIGHRKKEMSLKNNLF